MEIDDEEDYINDKKSYDSDDDQADIINFSNLPNELLIIIFEFLNHNDLKSIKLVCNRWLDSLKLSKIQKKNLLKISNVNKIDSVMELFSKSTQQYQNFYLENIHMDLKVIEFLSGQQLQSITFDTIVFKEIIFLKILRFLFENLKDLHIKNCIFIFEENFNEGQQSTNSDSHTILNDINDNRNLINEITNELINKPNSLNEFSFLEIPRSSYNFFLKLQRFIKPNTLEKIRISILKPMEGQEQYTPLVNDVCCDLHLIMPLIITQKETLRDLELYDISRNCCKQYLFNHITHLSGLGIYRSNALTDHDIVFLTKNLVNLRKFELKSCHSLTNLSGLAMENLKNIKELTISECSGILAGINSSGIKNGLAKHENENLKKLCLIFMDINTDCMIKLSEQFKNLTVFIYQYPITKSRFACKITDFALQAILKNLKSLKILDIMGCQWVTDYGLTGYDLDAITDQGITGCDNLTGKKDGYTINDLKQLEALNLIGCDKLSDFFILKDFSLDNLKVLRIPRLSLSGMKILTKHCKYIEFLEFKNDYETDVLLCMAIESFRFLKMIKILRFCNFSRKRMEIRAQRFEPDSSNIGVDCPCSICDRIRILCENFQQKRC